MLHDVAGKISFPAAVIPPNCPVSLSIVQLDFRTLREQSTDSDVGNSWSRTKFGHVTTHWLRTTALDITWCVIFDTITDK